MLGQKTSAQGDVVPQTCTLNTQGGGPEQGLGLPEQQAPCLERMPFKPLPTTWPFAHLSRQT